MAEKMVLRRQPALATARQGDCGLRLKNIFSPAARSTGKVARGHAAAFRCGRAGDSILGVPKSPERTGRQLA
jgi:hypothetical protein